MANEGGKQDEAIERALAVLRAPGKAERGQLEAAAQTVNDGIARLAEALRALQERYSRESLDMLAGGREAEARRMAGDIVATRERLAGLSAAAAEANRRMQRALDEAVLAEERKAWDAARALMRQRMEVMRAAVEAAKEFGRRYAEAGALADRVWDALPRKPHSNPGMIACFDPAGMEQAFEFLMHYASGWQFGERRLGQHPVPNIVEQAEIGHQQLLAVEPRKAVGQVLEVSAEEFERRRRAVA